MKLWNVKNSVCVKSLEVSDDDATVWALAVNTKEDRIITGASNSTLILWKVMSLACVHESVFLLTFGALAWFCSLLSAV